VSTPQNTIAIVYDYDQTLSPSYMQDEVVFPAFGINGENFWRRCSVFSQSYRQLVESVQVEVNPRCLLLLTARQKRFWAIRWKIG
jgi:hypothetical protein